MNPGVYEYVVFDQLFAHVCRPNLYQHYFLLSEQAYFPTFLVYVKISASDAAALSRR